VIRLALAQINPTVGDLKGNQQKIIEFIRRGKALKVDMVIFPEMAVCGYPPEDLLYKDSFVQENIKMLKGIQKETKGIQVVVGFVDRDKAKNLYNAAAVMANGKMQGVYHKQELPNYGVFDEKRYFVSGQGAKRFSVKGVSFGVSICEDIWVNAVMSKYKGALHINISCSPYDIGKQKQRENLLKQRAKAMKATVVYVNLVGGQDELVFDGGSLVMGPQGQVLASAKEFEEDLVMVDLSVGARPCVRPIKGPVQDFPLQIERVYKALVLGTRDYVHKNGFQKVLIGLSGGIDSALVAVVAVNAVGKENVVGVSMPSRYSSQGTQSDAKKLAKNLGIEFKEIPIEGTVKSYDQLLTKEFAGLKADIAEENIQARIRGNILMALSNKFGWMVLTTGNKSEMAVGYCTLYGDMSGGFAVIKDVPKMMVYALAEFINLKGQEIIPNTILTRPPSAELRSNQKDQDSLPPYEVLDGVLIEYVEKHRSVKQIAKKYDLGLVQKMIQMVDRSEYKRRQSPPGVKITSRAFGRDWRPPITNKYK